MMVSAGLNEEQALAATRTASMMATATFGDAGEAAAALATLYNTLGDKTKPATAEIGRLGDVVTKTQQTFQLKNLDQLTEGLKYGVPAAKMYGMSLEELSTVIGMLNNAGLQGSQAGTSFAASMQKIIPASRELGFAIAKNKDGTLDFGGTLTNIHNKLGDFASMSDASKLALEKAFGGRGERAIALLADQAGLFASNLTKVRDNAGVAATATAYIEARGSAPLDILVNKATAAKVALGDALSPAIGPYVDAIGKAVDSVGNWISANQGLISGGLDTAIGTVTPIVKAFGDSFMAALPAIKEALGALFNGFGSGATWLETAKSAAGILGKIAVGAIAVAAVFGGALAAGFQVAVDLCNDVIAAWNGMIAGLGATVFFFADWASDIAAKWRWLVGEASSVARAVVDGLINGFKDGAQWVIDAAKNLGHAAIDGIKNALHINSPSREFAEVGRFSALGVAQGINDNAAVAVDASRSMASQVLAAMEIKAPAVDASALDNAWATPAPPVPAPLRLAPPMPAINARSLGSDYFGGVSLPSLPQNPQAMMAGVMAAQQAPNTGGAGNAQASAKSSKEQGEALAAAMTPAIVDALKKGRGEITVNVKGGSGTVDKQPESGFTLNMSPSGGY